MITLTFTKYLIFVLDPIECSWCAFACSEPRSCSWQITGEYSGIISLLRWMKVFTCRGFAGVRVAAKGLFFSRRWRASDVDGNATQKSSSLKWTQPSSPQVYLPDGGWPWHSKDPGWQRLDSVINLLKVFPKAKRCRLPRHFSVIFVTACPSCFEWISCLVRRRWARNTQPNPNPNIELI